MTGHTTLGAILAGGAGARMGGDKAEVAIAGKPMVAWVGAALREIAIETVVVGRTGELAGLTCLPDDATDRSGPLAGLATALRVAGERPVALVAVDQPFLRPATLAALAKRWRPGRAVVPYAAGTRQVTCAIYSPGWAAEAAAELARRGSIQSLLDRLDHDPVAEDEWRGWGEDGRSWFSVDTPTDLEAGLARFGAPGGDDRTG